ncbi:Uncharacterised protein [Kocuria rosea]|nr:Uncharacterised protein [Kocuria rosea]
MQNQTVHSAAVRRRRVGAQIPLASSAGRGPCASAARACSGVSARERPSGRARSNRRTAASASSVRPRCSRKRTDSGRARRTTTA